MRNNLLLLLILLAATPAMASQQSLDKSTTLPAHFTHGDYRALMDDNIDKINSNDTELYRLAHDSYSSLHEYDDGDVVTSNHTLYVSLQDNNTGHSVTDTSWWQEVQTGGGGSSTFLSLSDTPSSYSADNWLKVNSAGDAIEFTAAPTGSGDVAGPSSSTDNGVARFGGTPGKIIRDSNVTVDDNGAISAAEYKTTAADGDRYQYVANSNGYTGSGTPVSGWWNYDTGSGHFEFYDGSGWDNYFLTSESGQFAAITQKTTPVDDDILLIEDSADSNSKKRITISSLPSGGSSMYVSTPPTYSDEACTPGNYAIDSTALREYLCAASGNWDYIGSTGYVDWNNPTPTTYSLTVYMVDGNGTDKFTYSGTDYTTDQTFTGLTADATFTVTPDTDRTASCTGTGLTDNGSGSYTANTDSENVTATCTYSNSVTEHILGTEWTADGTRYNTGGYSRGNIITADHDGNLTKLCVRLQQILTSTPGIKLGVYATASGVPTGDPLGQVVGSDTTTGNHCYTLSSSITITSGNSYFIGYIPEDGDTQMAHDATTGTDAYKASNYNDEFTSPAGSYTSGTTNWSLWGVYEY